MQFSQALSMLNGLLLSTNVVAFSFSPYVDLTLNTHWDSETQQMQAMDLVSPALKHGIKAYHLAFITDSGQCHPAWGSQQAYSVETGWGSQQTNLLTKKGIQINVSFGGANGNDISSACNQSQLVRLFKQVITTYHANALDFDIENGSADVPKLLSALKIIHKAHPKIKLSFTLPVMPEGLTFQGKEVVKAAQKEGLEFTVNVMAMDYGPAYGGDMGQYATQAAYNVQQFLKTLYPKRSSTELWQQVEITPMIGVNDVATEHFTLDNADYVKSFALKNHLGGIAMWSLTRDKPCADKWASPTCSGGNLQQKEYEFVDHFLATH